MYDYIIVGQGLAGSLLAYELIKSDCKVLVINNESQPSSARVAAGIYNPVTGKHLAKTWLADELYPFLKKFYREIEEDLSVKFLHEANVYRPFATIEQQNYFLSQTVNHGLNDYITDAVDNQKYNHLIKNDLGGLDTLSSGWVDLHTLLDAIRRFLIQKNAYLSANFDYDSLQISENQVVYEQLESRRIVFCEGYYAVNNPWFSWLPFNPVKGEVLNAEIENYDIEEIVNQGFFILPLGGGKVRIGATYVWHQLDWQTTEDGKQFLLQKVDKLLKAPYKITGQVAGIRPATKDRRPIVGNHPTQKNVYVLNGLGTKGVSLAPYFVDKMVAYLEKDEVLMPEVNIERFYSLYFRC